MIARTRQNRSRSPRGQNDTLRAMASFPAGFTTPQERERVSILVHEDTVDFHDPLLSVSETPTAQTMMEPTPRLNIARELEPTRPAVVVRPPLSPNIDLTTAQMFVDPCRLPRTPPRQESPERSSNIMIFRQANDSNSQDILEDFREVRLVLHTYTPRQIYLLQQGLQFLQCRQFCLMPCHRCVAMENGVLTYRCGQCVRPRLPERRSGVLRMHHECLCNAHFATRGVNMDDWVWHKQRSLHHNAR